MSFISALLCVVYYFAFVRHVTVRASVRVCVGSSLTIKLSQTVFKLSTSFQFCRSLHSDPGKKCLNLEKTSGGGEGGGDKCELLIRDKELGEFPSAYNR